MRTRFEFVLQGDDAVLLRSAGEEALAEIAAAEQLLSRFRKDAVVARINRAAGAQAVAVPPALLELLKTCRAVHDASAGAFDPTAAADGTRLGFAGLARVAWDQRAASLRFTHPAVTLDFGGIGKGYALDRAADALEDAGVVHALLHGGTSSVLALGPRADGTPWPVGVPDPRAGSDAHRADARAGSAPLAWRGTLDRCALSVSTPAHVAAPAPAHVAAPAPAHVAAPVAAPRTRVAVARVPFPTAGRDGDEAARADAWSTARVAAGRHDIEIRDRA